MGMVANLLTIGNAVCGFVAVVLAGGLGTAGKFLQSGGADEPLHLELKTAAWLIIFGMIFDVLDGRVARSTRSSTDLGAQLDSLADVVTFGVAPAVLVFRMCQIPAPWKMWPWVLWCLVVAYFLGAVLRLARFTAESTPDESSHLCFKGLPSPGAAGVVASLAIFYFYLKQFKQIELKLLEGYHDQIEAFADYVPSLLPFVAGIVGYLMVSNRLRYMHVAGYLVSRRTFDAFAYVTFGLILIALFPEIILPCLFFAYLLSAPMKLIIESLPWRKGRSRVGAE